ncbi:MAG: hypothetical protein KC731_21870 [Myxococcales bacterium]|nr:hypothetical protein [Myxococcales bacterium]
MTTSAGPYRDGEAGRRHEVRRRQEQLDRRDRAIAPWSRLPRRLQRRLEETREVLQLGPRQGSLDELEASLDRLEAALDEAEAVLHGVAASPPGLPRRLAVLALTLIALPFAIPLVQGGLRYRYWVEHCPTSHACRERGRCVPRLAKLMSHDAIVACRVGETPEAMTVP